MNKLKNLTVVFAIFAFILMLLMVTFAGYRTNAYAYCDTSSSTNESNKNSLEIAEEEAVARGIYTALSIAINGGNGNVWTTVKNDVTIFPATVIVIVELYSSDTYQESYLNMNLVAREYIGDLNMGQTITATASTGGQTKYWNGRAYYKVDNNAWKDIVTGTCKIGPNGEYLGIL